MNPSNDPKPTDPSKSDPAATPAGSPPSTRSRSRSTPYMPGAAQAAAQTAPSASPASASATPTAPQNTPIGTPPAPSVASGTLPPVPDHVAAAAAAAAPPQPPVRTSPPTPPTPSFAAPTGPAPSATTTSGQSTPGAAPTSTAQTSTAPSTAPAAAPKATPPALPSTATATKHPAIIQIANPKDLYKELGVKNGDTKSSTWDKVKGILLLPFAKWIHTVGPNEISYLEIFSKQERALTPGTYFTPSLFSQGCKAMDNQFLTVDTQGGITLPDISLAKGLDFSVQVQINFQIGYLKDEDGNPLDRILQTPESVKDAFYKRNWDITNARFKKVFNENLGIITEGWTPEEKQDLYKVKFAIQKPEGDAEKAAQRRFFSEVIADVNEYLYAKKFGTTITDFAIEEFLLPDDIELEQRTQVKAKMGITTAEYRKTTSELDAQGAAAATLERLNAEKIGYTDLLSGISQALPNLTQEQTVALAKDILRYRAGPQIAENAKVPISLNFGSEGTSNNGMSGIMEMAALTFLQNQANNGQNIPQPAPAAAPQVVPPLPTKP